MSPDPKQIPPPGFVAEKPQQILGHAASVVVPKDHHPGGTRLERIKLPPVGAVFTDPTNPPGPGWLWSDNAAPPRWLPPDASSPYFQRAIEDAHKAASSQSSDDSIRAWVAGHNAEQRLRNEQRETPVPIPPPGCVEVGQMTYEAVAKATPQCWTKQHCNPDGTFNEDKYAAGFNACVESSPSPLPQSCSAPDQTGQDRGQGEGEPVSNAYTLPAQQSAVEWVWNAFVSVSPDPNADPVLRHDDALELARRLDEVKNGVYLALESRHEAWRESDDLRAQLALEQDNARQSREEIEVLKGDIAAMAANQGEWMRRAMAFKDKLAASDANWDLEKRAHLIICERFGQVQDQLDAARAEIKDLREQKRHLQDQLGSLSKMNAKERLAVADELRAAKADAEEERYETNRTASALQATEGLLKEVRAQLDAAQAEAAEMRKQRDMAGKQVLTLTAEINRLRKGITEIKAGTRIGWVMTDLGAKCEKLLNP